MSRYKLSNVRNKQSSSASTPTSNTIVSLTTILEPLPEPITTLSGTIPGNALYDTPPPASSKEQELEPAPLSQRSQRPRTSTERGSLYVESREKSRDRSEKIQRTKKRKSSNSRKVTSGHATDISTGLSDGGDLSSRAEAEDMPDMPDQAPTGLSQEDRSSHGNYTGRGRTCGRNQAQARVQRRNRSTRGSAPKATTGSASDSNNDSDSSVDPVYLASEVSKRINHDVSDISTQDLKAILRAVVADQTPAVGSPQRKAKVILSSSQQIKVGGGNHMDRLQTYSYKPSNTTNRTSAISTYSKSKRQKLNYQGNNNSATESETDYSINAEHHDAAPTDSETELKQDNQPTTPPSFRPSQYTSSPSPLPTCHVPIDPDIIGFLDLPGQDRRRETLDTATQDSTVVLDILGPQDSVSQQIQAPGRQDSFAADRITSAQRPLVSSQSSTTCRGGSTSSVSLGQPCCAPPKSTQPQLRLLPESRLRSRSIQSSSLRSSHIRPSPVCSLGMLHSRNTQGKKTVHANKTHARTKGSTSLLQRQHTRLDADRSPPAAKARARITLQAASGSARVIAAVQARQRQRTLAKGCIPSSEQIDGEAGSFPHPSPGPSVRAIPDLVPDNEEERVAKEAEAKGEEPSCSKKRKPAARDVFGNERQILTIAKLHLFAYSLVEGAYQTRGTLMQWASDIFEVTWHQELPNLPYERPSARTLQIMVNGMATLRGKVKENLRPIIQYGYDFDKPATTSETINRNLKTFEMIHPNRFHCMEYKPVYGHYESSILTQAIAAALFNGPTAVGILFRDFFEPLPLSTVAFVLANMQFCIEEWEHGFFQPRDLSTADMLNKYVAHFRGLKEAKAGALGRISRLQEEWFEFGFDYSGAIAIDEPYNQSITLRNEVRPDTPSEDLEEEPEHTPEPEPEPHAAETNGEGRYTARAKGKGRA